MKKRKLLALALCALGGAAWAQDPSPAPSGPPGGGPHGRHRPPPPLMEALDTNKDGTLQADEIANASKSLLTLDKNGDGKLTQDELRPMRPPGGPGGPGGGPGGPPPSESGSNGAQGEPPHERHGGGGPGGPGPGGRHRPPPPLMTALDTNKDGTLDAAEIANASKSLLTLDKNGDGQLTHDELRPTPPAGGPNGHPPDDQGPPPPPPDGGPGGDNPPPPPPQ